MPLKSSVAWRAAVERSTEGRWRSSLQQVERFSLDPRCRNDPEAAEAHQGALKMGVVCGIICAQLPPRYRREARDREARSARERDRVPGDDMQADDIVPASNRTGKSRAMGARGSTRPHVWPLLAPEVFQGLAGSLIKRAELLLLRRFMPACM